jgi:stage II sporulation protein M
MRAKKKKTGILKKARNVETGRRARTELEKYKEFWKFIKESKIFILTILGLFLVSGFVGFFYPEIYADILKKVIKEMLEKTEGMDFSQLLAFIIYNNLKTSLLGLLLGLLFGIFPMVVAVINGYLLGFVFNSIYNVNGFREFWRILPHGIFELPAFFLSLGLGLRLGYVLFFKNKEFKHNLKMCLQIFFYIILPLLLVAGLIETSLIFLLK